MTDPVVLTDGHTYERTSITAWLRSHRTSPLTNARLEHNHVVPNHLVKSQIAEWKDVHGEVLT
jgi:hypothetical protein